MKQKLLFLVMLVAGQTLTACGGDDDSDPAQQEQEQRQQELVGSWLREGDSESYTLLIQVWTDGSVIFNLGENWYIGDCKADKGNLVMTARRFVINSMTDGNILGQYSNWYDVRTFSYPYKINGNILEIQLEINGQLRAMQLNKVQNLIASYMIVNMG